MKPWGMRHIDTRTECGRSADAMQVKDLMTSPVESVTAQETVQRAAEIMKRIDCGGVPVVSGEKLVGIITDRDITIDVTAQGKGAATPIKEAMSSNLVAVEPNTDARSAANLMAQHQVRRLPVTEEGKLVGILAIADLARKNIFVSESGHALSDISRPVNEGTSGVH